MFFRIKQKINKQWFNIACKNILKTPSLRTNKKDSLVLLSMVSHDDLIKYLIAIKSLYYYLAHGQIIIVNDGSLTRQDKEILERQVSPSMILESEFMKAQVPKGGTWERLIAIARLVKEHYVIQLDTDTVTVADILKVKDCIADNRSFILGTYSGKKIMLMQEVCEMVKRRFLDGHIQVVAESNFNKLSDYEKLKYVRGCSGFAGFARASFSLREVEKFSQQMEEVLGFIKWSQWGSEQVTSNYIIANASNALVLPWPQYANFVIEPNVPYNESFFLHFFGTYRYKKGFYIRTAKKIIKVLNKKN